MRKEKVQAIVQRVLLCLLVLMLIFIGSMSVWALVFRPAGAGGAQNLAEAGVENGDRQVFSGIGTVRAEILAGVEGGSKTLVVAPVFYYDEKDRAFSEELNSYTHAFREATSSYINSIDEDSPELFDEMLLKNALLERYNANLKLGRINELYFTEYILID